MENIIIFKKLYHLPCLRKSSEVKVSLANLAIKHDIFFSLSGENCILWNCTKEQKKIHQGVFDIHPSCLIALSLFDKAGPSALCGV